MSNAFANDPTDTPIMSPGWTVQSSSAGYDQNLVGSAGTGDTFPVVSVNGKTAAVTLAAADVGALPSTAVATKQTATGEAAMTTAVITATGLAGADAANLAKLSDLQAIGAKLDALNAAMVAAGLEAAS